jgi:molybdenum cofactor synthesis domain-containing protein
LSELRVGVLTCSDSRSAGQAEDTFGRALIERAEDRGWLVVAYHVCPDDRECIAASLMEMTDVEEADVVITVGGTGLGPRDVTPEASMDIAERDVPGIAEFIRREWPGDAETGVLSRGVAIQRGKTLVVNLPGSGYTPSELFDIAAGQIELAVRMISGEGGT